MMDPNETLKETRELFTVPLHERDEYWHDRIADRFDALDDWLSKGGFLPTAWNAPGTSAVRKLNPDNPKTSNYVQSDGYTV